MTFATPVFHSITPLVETLESLNSSLIAKMIKPKHPVEYRSLKIINIVLSPHKHNMWMICKLQKESSFRYAILRHKNSRSTIPFILSARFVWYKIKSYLPK